MPAPCDDLVVVDLTQNMAGALTTMVLADAGAYVVKVEPPAGDRSRARPAWVMWNRGKRSVVADLGTPAGRTTLDELVQGADVLLDASTAGVDAASLRERN